MSQEKPTNTSGMTALEKARLLKQQAEAKKEEKRILSEQEQEQLQKELDEKYLVNKAEHESLLKTKEEKAEEVKSVRAKRLENIKTQRAAIKEIVGTEEGVELFKEHKKDIFSEDEEKLKNIKSEEKGLKGEVRDLEEKIVASEAGLKESYEVSTKGRQEKEEQTTRLEREEESSREGLRFLEDKIRELEIKTGTSFDSKVKKTGESYALSQTLDILDKMNQVYDERVALEEKQKALKEKSEKLFSGFGTKQALIDVEKEILGKEVLRDNLNKEYIDSAHAFDKLYNFFNRDGYGELSNVTTLINRDWRQDFQSILNGNESFKEMLEIYKKGLEDKIEESNKKLP